MRNVMLFFLMSFTAHSLFAQRFNFGVNFQYHVLKQVSLDKEWIVPSTSYAIYHATDNRWKFFSAGQSILIGTTFQLDYKKIYVVLEPDFNLNTYNYTVGYPTSPGVEENLTFKSLFYQIDAPLYVGYQFHSSSLLRYSFFSGGSISVPYHLETSFVTTKTNSGTLYSQFSRNDMKNILYSNKPYPNFLCGFAVHYSSLVRVDVRYIHRMNYPGTEYKATYNTVGVALTYYLPLSLLKKKIYYEN